jgi:pimeloyl-ACP methyl ester carboxylesterase
MSRWIGYGLVLSIATGFTAWLAHRSVYFPMRYPQGEWQDAQWLGVTDVRLTSADRLKLHGWYKHQEKSALVTLFLHGNAGNVTHRDLHIRAIGSTGSSVLVPDYRGYGRSEGTPTEKGLYADARAAYDWLRAQGWRAEQIVIQGESLGSAVAVDLATQAPCAGLVLEAPFTSVSEVAGRVVPVVGSWLVGGFDSKSKIGRLRVPLLIIHGTNDEVIGYDLGRALFEAAPQPKEFLAIDGAGHNNLVPAGGDTYLRKLREFHARIGGLR